MPRRAIALLLVLTALVAGGCVPSGSSTTPTGWEADMLGQINAERAAVGAAPLRYCSTLDGAADAHSADQASRDKMSHTGSDGSDPGVRAERAGYTGYSRWAENVAAGQPSVASVTAAWMGSSGHRSNILDGALRDIGMGLALSVGGTPYWTQVFGTGGTC